MGGLESARTSNFNKGRKSQTVDQRVSVCTDCRRSIYIFQEYVWTRRGLVHTLCEIKSDNGIKASS